MQQPAGQSGAGYTTCNLVVPTIGLSSRLLWEKRKEEKKKACIGAAAAAAAAGCGVGGRGNL